MTYLPRKPRRTRARGNLTRQALGDLASIVSSVENAVGTTFDVAADPYFPETLCHIAQLKQIQSGQSNYSVCAETPSGIPGGVGLDRLQLPLRGYVYARAHPWVFPVAGALVLALPFLLGYEFGKGGK